MNTARISLALLAALLAATAGAADLPRRKSGLWEIRTAVTGVPATAIAPSPHRYRLSSLLPGLV